MPRVSTHVLDSAHGGPAAGVALVLWFMEADGRRTVVAEAVTNDDGRTTHPLLSGETLPVGRYELEFNIGAYFRARGADVAEPPFLEIVPVRFGVADPHGSYHVPLLVSPWSYSTYRGS